MKHPRSLLPALALALPVLSYGADAAAQPWMEPAPPAASARVAPSLRLTEPAPRPTYDRTPRILTATLGGLGGGLAGAVTTGAIGFAVVCGAGCRGDFGALGAAVGAGFGAIPGALLGMPLGVTLVGRAMRGNGGYGWSLLGTLTGAAVATPLVFALGDSDAPITALVAGIALPLAGAVVGYELSSDADRSAPREPARGPTVAPALAATPGGAFAGVAGTF